MQKKIYLRVGILLVAAIFLVMTGCAKKETVKESSFQPQNESGTQPKQEEMKPSPVTAGKQKVTAEQKISELKDIHFDFDKYNLRPEDRKILSAHA